MDNFIFFSTKEVSGTAFNYFGKFTDSQKFRRPRQLGNQLIELFQPLATVTLVEEPGVEPEPSAEAQIPLEELNLSVRAYNCLKRAQVNSVSDLMGFSYEDLLEIKNFGSKSADEVIEALERIGISLPQSRTSA